MRRIANQAALENYPHLVEIATKLSESGYDNAVEFAWGLDLILDGSTGFVTLRPRQNLGVVQLRHSLDAERSLPLPIVDGLRIQCSGAAPLQRREGLRLG